MSAASRSSARDGTLCLLPLLHAGVLSAETHTGLVCVATISVSLYGYQSFRKLTVCEYLFIRVVSIIVLSACMPGYKQL